MKLLMFLILLFVIGFAMWYCERKYWFNDYLKRRKESFKVNTEIKQQVLKERELTEIGGQCNLLIRDIVWAVEQLNAKNGIPEVVKKTPYFEESNEALVAIGYDDSFDILRFVIPLNKISKWGWFWNGGVEQRQHKYYWDWGIGDKHIIDTRASVEEYTNLLDMLKGVYEKLQGDLK